MALLATNGATKWQLSYFKDVRTIQRRSYKHGGKCWEDFRKLLDDAETRVLETTPLYDTNRHYWTKKKEIGMTNTLSFFWIEWDDNDGTNNAVKRSGHTRTWGWGRNRPQSTTHGDVPSSSLCGAREWHEDPHLSGWTGHTYMGAHVCIHHRIATHLPPCNIFLSLSLHQREYLLARTQHVHIRGLWCGVVWYPFVPRRPGVCARRSGGGGIYRFYIYIYI